MRLGKGAKMKKQTVIMPKKQKILYKTVRLYSFYFPKRLNSKLSDVGTKYFDGNRQ